MEFSVDDFFDGHAIFEYLSIRALRRDDFFLSVYSDHALAFGAQISSNDYESARLNDSIVTVFDLCQLGQSLVRVEFNI